MPATVFIGVPVYNGERYLKGALDCLCGQTYSNWKMLISDNASTDHTEQICRDYAKRDSRITYFRQDKNMGAAANFDYVLDRAEGDYFMWAAHDDEWDPRFLEATVSLLEEDPAAGFAFCNAESIDAKGVQNWVLPPYTQFATESRFRNIFRYIQDYESKGKASLFYSLYRLSCLKKIWPRLEEIVYHPDNITSGADMACVMGVLARVPLKICPEILYRIRWERPHWNTPEEKETFFQRPMSELCLSIKHYPRFRKYMLQACQGTRWWALTWLLMTFRQWRLKRARRR